MEQLTYLLVLKRLDDLQTRDENMANRLGEPVTRTIFPDGADDRGRPYADYRWSRFKHLAPAEMFTVIGEHVFPFLRTLGGEGSTYATHMRDARFTIPTPGLLQKAVDGLDKVPMIDRDTKGDVYEYMLSKEAGGFGLFIRRLVGLDRAAAKDAFAGFLDDKRYNADQIEFVNLVIDELTQNGVIEPRRFYESPFTDLSPQGPDALFESVDVDRLLDVVAEVRRRAEAA